ncbi:aryl-sulfate sulfotransferase [Sphingomonas sp. Tas61C01]|uniref:aryl-sulfate sulfotransferase n=1 Tax=Sphingomonas sp. Tas61C01 TaxID=3458297 RepID=UPI00403EF32B
MPGRIPSPGVVMIEPAGGPEYPYAVDLEGKLVWYYTWPDHDPTVSIGGMQQMANGHFIAAFASRSDAPLAGIVDRDKGIVREFDLAGNTIRQISVSELNRKLASRGFNVVLDQFHHHVEVLPNGHWLLLSNTTQTVDGAPVLGDVVVDLDDQLNPVFVWNSFDHLDTSRHPFDKADWTHANAVTYSPTDGNFLVSMRHQHWVVKVNYRNGAGDGSLLWRLGAGGDFTLTNGRNPTDWEYAQHFPFFTGKTSAGIFNLLLMDNGNLRPAPNGTVCGSGADNPCYTTIPEFRLDEQARTATIVSRVIVPTALYSIFGGNAEILGNGNIEYALSGVPTGGVVQEVTPDDAHALVWSLTDLNGKFIYRGYRLTSLYPGVTWQ